LDIINELNNSSSIPGAFFKIASAAPEKHVYTQSVLDDSASGSIEKKPQDRPRKYINRNYSEVSLRVRKIASYLISAGLKPGERVAIISNSRCEWMEADLAILSAGGVSVSVYQSLLTHDIAYILHDSEAKMVFAENEEQVSKLREISTKPFAIPAIEGRTSCSADINIKKIITFEKCNAAPDLVSFEDICASDTINEDIAYINFKRDDLAALVYTSGTTGPAKGVMQTHGNHLANVRQAYQARIFQNDSKIMIVLPLAHSFAKLMGYICFLTTATAIFPAIVDKKSSKLNVESLTKDISTCGATLFPLVPRMIEKMKEAIEKRANKKNLLGALLKRAFRSKHFAYNPLKNLIKKKLFGPNFIYVISGGAKLSIDVINFFDQLGIDVLEGYGLTETCVATNVNPYGAKKIGTVGPVLAPDIELTLSEEGEILYRGPNISKGYLNRPEATKASWDSDGRFHTGDLGAIDQDGYLSITGRKKGLIVTAGGKKIPPENIENKIKGIQFVSQAIMVGEGKPYCAALVTVNYHDARKSLEAGGSLSDQDFWAKLHALIWKDVEKLNQSLASFESIKKIELLKEDFTIENGLLTPTLKIKRNEVTKKYKNEIEGFYKSVQ
jgi:long-chain acyl-CoA synthetase